MYYYLGGDKNNKMEKIKKLVRIMSRSPTDYSPEREFDGKVYLLSALAPSKSSAQQFVDEERKNTYRPIRTRTIKRNTQKHGMYYEVWIYQP